jgi:hypothetical protein
MVGTVVDVDTGAGVTVGEGATVGVAGATGCAAVQPAIRKTIKKKIIRLIIKDPPGEVNQEAV